MRPEDTQFRVIEDSSIPRGVVYLIPDDPLFTTAKYPLIWYRDPWPPAPTHLSEVARRERDMGLEFLGALLDGMCRGLGLDPDEVWRGPKQREQDAWIRQCNYVATERLALSVLRPESFIKITGV